MTPEALAALHADAFPGPPRPWSADEFRTFLRDPSTVLYTAENAFLLVRLARAEAEVLTLCTAPKARRRGQARDLMQRFEADARTRGVAEVFLEVAQSNGPARALYAKLGYHERGHRKDYYSQAGRAAVHAYVLGKQLG
ncbi:MAG: GNAT family N-acetyltransferase [Pseudomonadota bacterium]